MHERYFETDKGKLFKSSVNILIDDSGIYANIEPVDIYSRVLQEIREFDYHFLCPYKVSILTLNIRRIFS